MKIKSLRFFLFMPFRFETGKSSSGFTTVLSIIPFTVLLFFSQLTAGTTGKIAGVVIDARSNEPLAGANVLVKARMISGNEISLDAPLGAATNVDGQYFILNVPPGIYIIETSYIGYQTMIRSNVRVEVDRTARINFELSEESLTTEEIVVTAERIPLVVKDQTSASSKISGDDIEALPVETYEDVVKLTAGVSTGIDGSLHIRGGRSSEIQFYVDGIQVSNPFNNSLAVQVSNNAIQELEVISGTFNAEYGQAMSGIVNIVTREGTELFRGSVSVYTGDFLSDRKKVFYNIDDINPLAQQYFEGNLSGPIIGKIRFFASAKYQNQENWLYGRQIFLPSDSTNMTAPNPDNYYIESSGDSGAVPMAPYENFSGQFKLTWQMTPTLKVSYNVIGNRSEGKFYSNYYKYNPESRPTSYSWGLNHIFRLDHTLSARMFYTLSLSYYQTDTEQYKYKNPYDSRYSEAFRRGIYQPSFVLSTGGVDQTHFMRGSKTITARADLMYQADVYNFLKLGLETRLHYLDYQIYTLEIDPNLYGDKNTHIPPLSSVLHNKYSEEPVEFAAYIQDKIEIEDLIVNAGLRFDYFNSNGIVPKDFRDPANKLFPRPDPYEKVEPKIQLSPRLGLAFPISAQGVIHAAYGQFFQIPEFSRLYENPEFEVIGSYNSFIGNSDLDAQRTDMYEIGLQQQLNRFIAVDVTAFYRDIRNLLGSQLFVAYQNDIIYGRYVNTDHGNVRGITISAKIRLPESGISSGIDYTYQVAKGIASDPKQAFFDAGGRNEGAIILSPLSWDLRHIANVFVNYATSDWGASVIARMNSGYPFTPADPTTQRQSQILELRNQGRYQGEFFLDLRAYKRFQIGNYGLELFVKIENLLDSYRKDLLPEVDPINEQTQTENAWNIINTRYEFEINPALQPVPREVKLGLTLDF